VQSAPGPALVWNASDPGFGSYAAAVWPPAAAAVEGLSNFSLLRKDFCTDISAVTTDGTSCLKGAAHELRAGDKVTCHTRTAFTLHLLNSSRVHTQHSAIHGAPGCVCTL
jgi:hypothetical protein